MFDTRRAFIASLAGVAMGALSLTGALSPAAEFGAWVVVGLAFWVPLVLSRFVTRPVLTLAMGGLLAGVWTGAIQAAFATTLVTNNPAWGESAAAGVTPAFRAFAFATAVGAGLVWGALVGVLSLLPRKIMEKRRMKGAPDAPAE